jgi:hypothetical protein
VDKIGGVVFGAMEEIYTLGDEGARSWKIEPILMGHEDRIAYLRRAYGLEAEGFDLRPTPAAPAGR